MENILDRKPKCLASHRPTLEYSAGQEVRAHPGKYSAQSRISHVTLGNFSLRVSQVILEIGSMRSPAAYRGAGLFHGGSESLDLVRLYTHLSQIFSAHTLPSRS